MKPFNLEAALRAGTVQIGPCQHLQAYPFHNTTNGERGRYCLQCGAICPTCMPSGEQAAVPEDPKEEV